MTTAFSFSRFPRSARMAAVCAAMGAAVVATATTAGAASIDIGRAGPEVVEVGYTCAESDGVASVQAMMGEPTADRPASQGTKEGVTCDGKQQTASISMASVPGGTPLQSGKIQVRVALVDRNGTVVTGQAKLFGAQ